MMLTDDIRAKLAPFLLQLATLTDDGLAAAAEVTVEQAAAFRAEQAGEKPEAPPEPVKAKEPKPPKEPKEPKAEKPKPEAPPEPEEAPAAVIVVRASTLPRDGRPFRTSYWGVYSGADAAWLWQHDRANVEPFDVKRHG